MPPQHSSAAEAVDTPLPPPAASSGYESYHSAFFLCSFAGLLLWGLSYAVGSSAAAPGDSSSNVKL